MFASISFQQVKRIRAHAYPELESAPLIIQFDDTNSTAWGLGEVTIHTENPELSAALVEAINAVVAAHQDAETVVPAPKDEESSDEIQF